jgi:ribose-phosphate pyrophosphokinase
VTPLLYTLPGNEPLAAALLRELGAEAGTLEVRRFPDGESYLRLHTSPAGREVVLVASLDRPNEKILDVYFAATLARELGARRVGLVAPYLAYLRQDARFRDGEAITSVHFARWLSGFLDWLVTVDPHLHRHPSLDAVYGIPSAVASAAPAMARWIRAHVAEPLVIGPDAESAPWAARIAAAADCPHRVLEKRRHGDRDVEIAPVELGAWRTRTPVLIDDIVSTARTLIAAIAQLRAAGMTRAPVCVGVHALFAGDALEALRAAGAALIATCNTVSHATNAIDISAELAAAVRDVLGRRQVPTPGIDRGQ